MDTEGFFYCGIEVNERISDFVSRLRAYSDEYCKPVYIIDKALRKIPKLKIMNTKRKSLF